MSSYIDEILYHRLIDVSEKFGLNARGAKALVGEIVKKEIVVDVGLGGNAKYTKAKQ